MAVDLVDFAHRRKYSQAFLLSGDADFMQALYKIKKLHIPVSVLCMNNKIMYKALLFYKTFVIRFNRKIVRLKKIRRKPDYLTLDKRVIRKV